MVGLSLAETITIPRHLQTPEVRVYINLAHDFKSLNELEQLLLAFERRYEETASPLEWTFTRKDLTTLLAKIENKRLASAA
jgi:hypothetical protein